MVFEWELTVSPGGGHQWTPKDGAGGWHGSGCSRLRQEARADDVHDRPFLRMDPEYDKISRHFLANPQEFADVFARAWYKLTHRDMGPHSRYLGKLVPAEALIWQDPVPAIDFSLIDEQEAASLKAKILASGLSISLLVTTAWASASTFRGTDKRGGANGARIRLEPQKNWEVNQPAELAKVLSALEAIQAEFNGGAIGRQSFSCRPDRVGWMRSRRSRSEEGRLRPEGSIQPWPHGCFARANPMCIRSQYWNQLPTDSATTSLLAMKGLQRNLCWIRRIC